MEDGLRMRGGGQEEPARVAGESAAGRKGTRRSEKAKVSEEALTRSSKAKKPMNACVHTYTKSQTPSTRRRGPGWRIHASVEDTKLSTNKQHTLSLEIELIEAIRGQVSKTCSCRKRVRKRPQGWDRPDGGCPVDDENRNK